MSATVSTSNARGARVRVRRHARTVADPLLFVLVGLAVWASVVEMTGIHSLLLPSPLAVAEVMGASAPLFLSSMVDTLVAFAWGFGVGSAFGFVSGVAIAYLKPVRQAIFPSLVALYVLPKVVFIPLFIIWWGPGLLFKVVITALLVFFPVTENTIKGLEGVNRNLVDLSRSFGSGEIFTFVRIKLPSSLPFIFAGLRIGVTEAFIGVVLCEMLVPSEGIGARTLEGALSSNTEFILASLIYLAVGGIIIYFVIDWIGKRATFWI